MNILDLPALAPPEGVVPNFENPESLRHPELAVIQFTAATLVVAIRIYTKYFIVRKMLVEDYWLLVAWSAFVGFQVLAFILEDLPLGVHQWDLTIGRALQHAKLFHITVGVYALVVIPLKVAIILQIRRIFTPLGYASRSQRILRWVIDIFLVLNVMFYLGLLLFQFLMCRPLEAAWNPFMPGKCVKNRFIVHIVSASINTASDLIIMLLPQPAIWGLNMERKRQWGLSAVFLVGGLACAASVVRLYYSVELETATDQTYTGALMGKWAEPELTFGFLVACLPVIPTFFKHMYRKPGMQKLCCCFSARKTVPTQSDQSGGSNHAATIGSSGTDQSGRKKMRDMDIEFAELTRPDSREGQSSCGGSPVQENWDEQGKDWDEQDKDRHDGSKSPGEAKMPV